MQFYQETPSRAEFRFVPNPHFEHARLPLVEASVRRKLGDDFQIEPKPVRKVEKMAAGKHKWLVTRLG